MPSDPREAVPDELSPPDRALLELLRFLKTDGYAFVTPTPATHARVLARPGRQQARSLRDALGWSLPFAKGAIGEDAEALLRQADMLRHDGDQLFAQVRVSCLHGQLFLHSAYPTTAPDCVFFGPDSYRFADLVRGELAQGPGASRPRIVDIGTGSGVGAIVASRACPLARVSMTDINPVALRFARVNAIAAGVMAEPILSATLEPIEGEIDIVVANPPYIIDPHSRLYRDGGAMHGGQVSVDMLRMAADRLAPGGRMILYTGSAIVDGTDDLRRALGREAAARELDFTYRELDPDIFGDELEQPAYRDVERIALVAAVIGRRD